MEQKVILQIAAEIDEMLRGIEQIQKDLEVDGLGPYGIKEHHETMRQSVVDFMIQDGDAEGEDTKFAQRQVDLCNIIMEAPNVSKQKHK